MFLQFEFNRILKCVTKRECVTSRVRKDARGYCTYITDIASENDVSSNINLFADDTKLKPFLHNFTKVLR